MPSGFFLLSGKAEASVVVAVVGPVPVTDSRPHVPGIIVPAATTYNTVVTLRLLPIIRNPEMETILIVFFSIPYSLHAHILHE